MSFADPTGGRAFRRYYADRSERGVCRPLLSCALTTDQDEGALSASSILPEQVLNLMKECGLEFLSSLAGSMSWNLHLMAVTLPWPDALDGDFVNPVMELRRALPRLIPAAGEVSKVLEIALGEPECPEAERRRVLLVALESFMAASDIIIANTRDTGGDKSSAHWHDDAYFLAIEIHEHASALGQQVALSKHDSAGVLLIEKLLDLAKVNHSGASAIAKELNRRRGSEPFLAKSAPRSGLVPN